MPQAEFYLTAGQLQDAVREYVAKHILGTNLNRQDAKVTIRNVHVSEDESKRGHYDARIELRPICTCENGVRDPDCDFCNACQGAQDDALDLVYIQRCMARGGVESWSRVCRIAIRIGCPGSSSFATGEVWLAEIERMLKERNKS